MAKNTVKKNNIITADIIVKFRINRVCTPEDLKDSNMSLEEMVKLLIRDEGLFSIVDELNGEILEIKEV